MYATHAMPSPGHIDNTTGMHNDFSVGCVGDEVRHGGTGAAGAAAVRDGGERQGVEDDTGVQYQADQVAAKVLEQSTTDTRAFRHKVNTVRCQELETQAEDHGWARDVETSDEEENLQGYCPRVNNARASGQCCRGAASQPRPRQPRGERCAQPGTGNHAGCVGSSDSARRDASSWPCSCTRGGT